VCDCINALLQLELSPKMISGSFLPERDTKIWKERRRLIL
jgi:hypothetical protein